MMRPISIKVHATGNFFVVIIITPNILYEFSVNFRVFYTNIALLILILPSFSLKINHKNKNIFVP